MPDYGIVRANGAPVHAREPRRRRPDGDHARAARRGPAVLHPAPGRAVPRARRHRRGQRRRARFRSSAVRDGEGNKKLSKRDPQSSLNLYRERGFLPEGLLNYLSLLGWSLAEDRDIFSMEEMVAAFDIADVSGNPARFDLKKCGRSTRCICGRCRRGVRHPPRPLPPGRGPAPRRAERRTARPARRGGPAHPGAHGHAWRGRRHARLPLREAGGLPARRGGRRQGADRGRPTGPGGERQDPRRAGGVRRRADPGRPAREPGGGPGHQAQFAFTPLRVAVTGRRVSPPLFESMELLGREETLRRLRAAL
ncbi:glutamate--tRNA ligase family protein [Streptomyces sp. M19]